MDLLKPPGLLADIASFAADNAARHQPMYNVAAAIATLSSLSANKFRVRPTNNALNVYMLIEGESGGGKSSPRDTVVVLHREAHFEEALLSAPASAPALLKNLADKEDGLMTPTRCVTIDEFGKHLKHARNPASHQSEVITELVRL